MLEPENYSAHWKDTLIFTSTSLLSASSGLRAARYVNKSVAQV